VKTERGNKMKKLNRTYAVDRNVVERFEASTPVQERSHTVQTLMAGHVGIPAPERVKRGRHTGWRKNVVDPMA